MTENETLQFIILVILVLFGALVFYVGYSVVIGWICGTAGDGLAAC